MTTLQAIKLLKAHGASADQMAAVLLTAKVAAPSPGMRKVFSGVAADFVKTVGG